MVVSGVSMILCNVLEKEKFCDGLWGSREDFDGSSRGHCYDHSAEGAHYYKDHSYAEYLVGGIITASVGAALLIAGAPTYVVANKKLKRVLQIAEESKMAPPYKTACTFDFNTRYGVGVNISF